MFLLIACTLPKTPDEVALRACRGMPGLEVDAAGQALLRDVIDPDEWALWRSDTDYGPVMERIGLDGYGTVRANVTCRLVNLDETSATLIRTEPDLDLLLDRWDTQEVVDQPRIERTLVLDFRDERVHLDLARHRGARDGAMELADAGRYEDAIAALDAIELHDPMLPLWMEEVRRMKARVEAEARAEAFLEGIDQALDETPEEPDKLQGLEE